VKGLNVIIITQMMEFVLTNIGLKFGNNRRKVRSPRTFFLFFHLKTIACIILLFLIACLREKEISLEEFYEERPVVYSILNPEEDIHVHVSKTVPFNFLGKEIPVIPDAKVVLTGYGTEVEIPFHQGKGIYFISRDSFNVSPGKSYQLKIFFRDGQEIMATTAVPKTKPVWESIGQEIIVRNPGDETSALIRFHFAWQNDWKTDGAYYVFSEDIFQHTRSGDYFIIPEETQQGNIIGAVYTSAYSNFHPFSRASVSLVKTSAEMKIFTDYEGRLRLINDQLDMGMFWELYRGVIPEYTNIDGGYGVFGSYLKTDTTISIRSMY
jgi:hypothetical protein